MNSGHINPPCSTYHCFLNNRVCISVHIGADKTDDGDSNKPTVILATVGAACIGIGEIYYTYTCEVCVHVYPYRNYMVVT